MIVSSLIFAVFASAQAPADQIKDNLSEKQQQLEEINNEIQELQKEITKKQRQTASLKNEVALFDLQIRQTENQIASVQLEIENLSVQILGTQVAIQQKTEAIEKQKILLAETLRLIYEYDSVTALEITLGNETFSELLDQIQYATNLQEKDQELLNSVKTLKRELEQKKAELAQKLTDQENLKNQLVAARDSLDDQRGRKQAVLTATRGQEKIYQSLLTEANQKQEQVEREIFELEVQIRRQIGDKTLPPIEGLLRWPMSGILTQGYGKTGFTALGYTFHNGIDVAAPAGTKIHAAGDGVVYATGTGKAAYGNWVVIKHSIKKGSQVYNIFTLYGHLRGFAVSGGQAVLSGDVIGYEGNTGNTTRLLYGPERGYHVHFVVFDGDGFQIKPGAYQAIYGPYQIPYGYTYDPLQFLR